MEAFVILAVGSFVGAFAGTQAAKRLRSRSSGAPLLDVQRLEMQTGDVLAVRSTEPLSAAVIEQITEQVKGIFPDNKVLVFGPEFDLQVVSASDCASTVHSVEGV